MSNSLIIMTYLNEWMFTKKKLIVYVNGVSYLSLKHGETKKFQINPGRYEIYSKVNEIKSNILTLDLKENEKIDMKTEFKSIDDLKLSIIRRGVSTEEIENIPCKITKSISKSFLAYFGALYLELILWVLAYENPNAENLSDGTNGLLVSFFWISGALLFIWTINILPSIIKSTIETIKTLGFFALILMGLGAVIWFIWQIFEGLAAMSTTTFLLLIIIWQLAAMQDRHNRN